MSVSWPSYHGPPDVGQPALGFALGKLQTADVLQTSSVLAHLFVDDQFHTPANRENQSARPAGGPRVAPVAQLVFVRQSVRAT